MCRRSITLIRAPLLLARHLFMFFLFFFCFFVGTQTHAAVLTGSCGELFYSASEDRSGYGENLYRCWGSGSGSCYTPEAAMASLCEILLDFNYIRQMLGLSRAMDDKCCFVWAETFLTDGVPQARNYCTTIYRVYFYRVYFRKKLRVR